MAFKVGKTLTGWGVVRGAPWHFAGLFETEAAADAHAASLGKGYEVHWGEKREGSDDFIWTGNRPTNEPARIVVDGQDAQLNAHRTLKAGTGYFDVKSGNGRLHIDSASHQVSSEEAPAGVSEEDQQQSEGSTLEPLTLTATATITDPPAYSAREVIQSSSWTGRRSLEEQALIVTSLAPAAMDGVRDLIVAIENKRFNDPAMHDAVDALKELHQALGELIEFAEAGEPLRPIFEAIEHHKERLVSALRDGAQVMLVSPTLAVGTATMLSWLAGFPMTGEMVTALCATHMSKDALLTLAKRR